jgi:quercetin dioxygenase-like cupin family protein
MKTAELVAAIMLLSPAGALAQAPAAEGGTMMMVPAAKVTFGPIDVPGFNKGMQIATVYGDPNAASGFYVIRLKFPPGYSFPPHWHPMAENLTVLQGQVMLGMGDKRDAKQLHTYGPGSFVYIPGKESHFGGASKGGAAIIQLHGQAPFKIEITK